MIRMIHFVYFDVKDSQVLRFWYAEFFGGNGNPWKSLLCFACLSFFSVDPNFSFAAY